MNAARVRRIAVRVGLGVLVLLLLVTVAGTGYATWTVRRSFPDYDAAMRLPGLSADVEVRFDDHGIPQVTATTTDDLFRAQGYLHARDRFWEMDFRRHVTAGRLAELFGQSQVETDAFLRTLGWRRVAEQEYALLTPATRRALDMYAAGVNAWLKDHSGSAASLEYEILGFQNSDYRVEPWHPVDSLAWLKAMAWDLRGNMSDEMDRAALLASGISRKQVEQLYPAYPFERHTPIVPGGKVTRDTFTPVSYPAEAGDAVTAVRQAIRGIPALANPSHDGIGSNSWVVAGSRTATGKPILANDPHLAPSMPGIWYQMGLRCATVDADCPLDVVGFTFSGVPGVVIGHNARIAWGFTNLAPDVTDLYLEQLNDDRQLVDGQWVPLKQRKETIKVAGGKPVTIMVRESTHGPLVSDQSPDMKAIGAKPPVAPDGTAGDSAATPAGGTAYGVALRWTALDPGRTADAILALNTATDWASFRAAALLFEVPAQNLVYADVDGNIGYQAPGKIPVRGKGDGRWPAPGWDSAYDWKSYLPFPQLPYEYNPARGYIVTANQPVIGANYPHLLTHDWAYGYRSQRINDLITGHEGPITVEDTAAMQFDNRNGGAEAVVPKLLSVSVSGGVAKAQALLRDWDLQQPVDSAPAAFYNATWRHLLLRVFDERPSGMGLGGGERWAEVLRSLLDQPDSPWWDDRGTSKTETVTDMLAAAMSDAYAELTERLGDDPAAWQWGDLHQLTLQNQTFGKSGIAAVEWLFNSGPHPVAGGGGIVNATGWNAEKGYEVTAVPSMRMVVDVANFDRSRWVQLTGNSGHAFHEHYDDQFELWRTGKTLPMRWSRDAIKRATENTLTLRP